MLTVSLYLQAIQYNELVIILKDISVKVNSYLTRISTL